MINELTYNGVITEVLAASRVGYDGLGWRGKARRDQSRRRWGRGLKKRGPGYDASIDTSLLSVDTIV